MMNNINVGASALRAQQQNHRGFYWPTTSFLMHEEEKKRRTQRSPRRVKSMDGEQHQQQRGTANTSGDSRAAQRRAQFHKSTSQSQDSYFNKTVIEESGRSQELATAYSPSTLRRVCNALSIQRHSNSKSHKSTLTQSTTTPTNKSDIILRRQDTNAHKNTSSLPHSLRKLGFLTRRKNVQQGCGIST